MINLDPWIELMQYLGLALFALLVVLLFLERFRRK